jgi:hypothetical protein
LIAARRFCIARTNHSAQVGSRLVEAVGKKRQDEFFGKLGQHLDG